MNLAQQFLLAALRCYRGAVSPVLTALFGPLGCGCRYTPTCSTYAIEAVCAHGAWHGSGLALRRLCRCHPWSGSGFDPVPVKPDSELKEPSPSRTDQSGRAGAGRACCVNPLS